MTEIILNNRKNGMAMMLLFIGLYVLAFLLLIFGAAMAATSLFLPPEGEIDGTVLMLFAQILVYAGSIFGVKIYIKDLVNQIKKKDEADRQKILL